jgi:hypothetical protein
MKRAPGTMPVAVVVGAVNPSWAAVVVGALVWAVWSWWRGRIEADRWAWVGSGLVFRVVGSVAFGVRWLVI